MLNYTAIDFETANRYRGSPCAVGLVRVRDGAAVDECRWFIQPPERYYYFEPVNIRVHGITESMVETAPRWSEIFPRIIDFIGDDIAVAHGAKFDIEVIRNACAADDIEPPAISSLCTQALATACCLTNKKLLAVICELGGIMNEDDHHDPLEDARGVVQIVTRLARRKRIHDLTELARSVGVPIKHWESGPDQSLSARVNRHPRPSASAKRTRKHFIPSKKLVSAPLNPEADRKHYLYGRVVVFTGWGWFNKQHEWDECSRLGAIAERYVTKRTNLLVVSRRLDDKPTEREVKATRYRDNGQEIVIMTHEQFRGCLGGDPWPSGQPSAVPDAHSTSRPTRTRPARQVALGGYSTEMEILICSNCGRHWQRERLRGRKPGYCLDCAAKG